MQSPPRTIADVIVGGKRDKSLNTSDFNRKAKKRREKAKHDAKARRVNQRRKK